MRAGFWVRWVLWLALALGGVASAVAQDVAGGQDHPLIQRYPGATLVGYAQLHHGSIDFQSTSYTGFDLDTGRRRYAEAPLTLDGRVTRLWYEAAGKTTSAQLYDYQARALTAQGFKALYDSTKDSGAGAGKWVNFLASFANGKRDALVNNRSCQVFSSARTASLRTGTFQKDNTTVRLVAIDWLQGDAASKARKGAYIAIDIVEARVLQEPAVRTLAAPADDALIRTLASSGRVLLAGAGFGSGSAVMDETTHAVLARVATYLKANPAVRLYVVGHTDGTGDLEDNLELSRQRAQAVVDTLEHDFEIDHSRLTAHGVGPLAPVADNNTAAGRAKNRRVELVRH